MGDSFPHTDAPLRLFIAIVPEEDTIATIHHAMHAYRCQAWSNAVRWLPKSNTHLTLRFLGETRHDQRQGLIPLLSDICGTLPPFDMKLDRLMFLPTPARTRVVAVRVIPCRPLKHLAETIEAIATSQGFEREKRPFLAHITLGRCRPQDLRTHRPDFLFDDISVPVRKIELIQSTLTRPGALYKTLATFEMSGSP